MIKLLKGPDLENLPIWNLEIIAFDPGKTTGWARLKNKTIEMGYFTDAIGIDALIKPKIVVIYELPFLQSTTEPIVVEVKGAIVERATAKGCQIVEQSPLILRSMKDGWNTHGKLAVIGEKGKKSDHTRDAFAHLAYYMWQVHKVSPDYLISLLKGEYLR